MAKLTEKELGEIALFVFIQTVVQDYRDEGLPFNCEKHIEAALKEARCDENFQFVAEARGKEEMEEFHREVLLRAYKQVEGELNEK